MILQYASNQLVVTMLYVLNNISRFFLRFSLIFYTVFVILHVGTIILFKQASKTHFFLFFPLFRQIFPSKLL